MVQRVQELYRLLRLDRRVEHRLRLVLEEFQPRRDRRWGVMPGDLGVQSRSRLNAGRMRALPGAFKNAQAFSIAPHMRRA